MTLDPLQCTSNKFQSVCRSLICRIHRLAFPKGETLKTFGIRIGHDFLQDGVCKTSILARGVQAVTASPRLSPTTAYPLERCRAGRCAFAARGGRRILFTAPLIRLPAGIERRRHGFRFAWSGAAARRAHNSKVMGANPISATSFRGADGRGVANVASSGRMRGMRCPSHPSRALVSQSLRLFQYPLNQIAERLTAAGAGRGHTNLLKSFERHCNAARREVSEATNLVRKQDGANDGFFFKHPVSISEQRGS